MNRQQLETLSGRAMGEPLYPDPRFPPSPYYRFFRLLTAETKPLISVELGVCGGGGSLHLALGWPAGTVIGVDLKVAYPGNIEHVKRTCPNFIPWFADSVDASTLAKWCRAYPVNILFIDTEHTYERVKAEFEAWKPLLADGAIVLLDDLDKDRVRAAFHELPGEKVELPALSAFGFGAVLL